VEHTNGEPAPDNVVDLQKYRRARKRSGAADDRQPHRLDDGATHVYIDLENGRLDYGLVKVNEENALALLEPWFHLGNELIKFYSE
jgi:hypothetical protein